MHTKAASLPLPSAFFSRHLAALVGAFTLASNLSTVAAVPVEIPDAALRQCVEKALDKEEGNPITQDDMESLTIIFECDGVSRLDGLEFATNLWDFSSHRGGISDLSPIADLSSLHSLGLTGHRISDLEIISGLDLVHLSLSNNPFSNLAPLAGLEQLAKLWLGNTNVNDLSPLVDLPRLHHLEVGGSPIRELPRWPPSAPLGTLYMGSTWVTDLSPLASLTALTKLGLRITDLSGLDLTVLSRLTSLNSLDLAHATSVDLESLSGVRELTELNLLGATIVGDLSPLANHTFLRHLNLAGLGLWRLEAVPRSVLGSLQNISLRGNLITEIRPLLSNGGELRRVNLEFNPWLSRSAVEVDIPALMARGRRSDL